MAFLTRTFAIGLSCLVTLASSQATAQAVRGVPLPQAPRLQPINVWQQYNLQQALLQQNALQQYALYQLQLQNPWLYPGLTTQPTVIFSSTWPLQQPNPFGLQQQQNALIYSLDQLQQQNALLSGMLQQQALMQQLQQVQQGAGQQGQPPQLLPKN
jgi:hypothetical protein